MVNDDVVGVELGSATALATFGSGLGSVGGVRLGPGQLQRCSTQAWTASAAFSLGLGGCNVRIWAAIHRCRRTEGILFFSMR
jgi:hypothetical protein